MSKAKKEKQQLLELIQEYKKQHKRDWLSFARHILTGYCHNRPTYEEATLMEFEDWLKEEL